MSDWKQRIREAKEWVELGVMTPEEFEDLKQQARKAIGLSTNAKSAANPQGGNNALHSFVPALHAYQSTMQGDWDEQRPSRLQGFLMDTLSDVESSTVRMFIQLSFQDKLLSLVQENDAFRLRQRCQDLSSQYNPRFVDTSCEVWRLVFSKKTKKTFPDAHRQQGIPSPKNIAPSTRPRRQPKSNGVQSIARAASFHELLKIPAGNFLMGALPSDQKASDNEKPRHRVEISRPFLLGKYAVTQDLYESVMGNNPSSFKAANHPVEGISWCDAVLFCNKLSEKEGLQPAYTLPKLFKNHKSWAICVTVNHKANGYRLPTEAEWEYAAKGGEDHLFAGSNKVDEVAWYYTNSKHQTHPVGQKKANAFGLYDMSGNVFEWVWDLFGGYRKSFVRSPMGPRTGTEWGYRGGACRSLVKYTRVTYRGRSAPSTRDRGVGFRLSRSATTK